MANTFKFGNKNWAWKEDYVLAYNDENNNFKPLPFDFTRSSSATRVNSSGLIETVGSGEPRIDYLNNADGHLLLEPSATNYSTNSENPSSWFYVEYGSGSAGTITTGKTDMFGSTNAVQVDFPANAENASLWFGSLTSALSSGTETSSVYIKLVGDDTSDKNIQIRTGGVASAITISGTEFVRYTASKTISTNEGINLKVRPSQGTSSGGFSIIICQPQSEATAYATSYIPTEGSSVTRAAELGVTQDNVSSSVINQSEGTVFADINITKLDLSSTRRIISLNNNSSSDRIVLYINAADKISVFVIDGSSSQWDFNGTTITSTGRYKIALAYKQNDFAIYMNGVQEGTSTSGTIPTMSTIDVGIENGASPLNDEVRDIKLYDTRLTNAELIALTS